MRNIKVNSMDFLILIVGVFILLLLSLININFYTSMKLPEKNVLGSKTETEINESFWNEFLNKNPNYIPGWVEMGRMDEVEKINPNFSPQEPQN